MTIDDPIRIRPVAHLRPLLAAAALVLALSLPAHAQTGGTALSIRITPRAAALIAALRQGMTPARALASLPAPDSQQAFAQTCNAEGGHARVTDHHALQQRVCL